MKELDRIFSVTVVVVLLAAVAAPGGSASAPRDIQAATWSVSRAIDLTSAASQLNPAVAADSAGNVYAVWEDYRNGDADIYFSQRSVDTAIWSTPIELNDDGGSSGQYRPTIARGGSYIYVAWEDYRNGDADIYSTRRLLSGGTWESNLKVNQDRGNGDTPDANDQKRPSLCMDAYGNAFAVWQDRRNGAKKTYYGQRGPWEDGWELSDKVTLGEGTYSTDLNEQVSPNIACFGTGSNLLRYAVWQDLRSDNANIFYGERSDDGTWNPESGGKIVDDTTRADQTVPAIAFDSAAKAWSVWLDERTGAARIWGASYPRGGGWSANFQVSNAGALNAGETHPRVVVAPILGWPYVVWIDASGNVAYSNWNGSSWTPQAQVSDSNTGTHLWPDIAAGSSDLYLVWQDGRSGNPHIYFSTTAPVSMENASWFKAWPVGVQRNGQFYLDMTVHNSEASARTITATVRLPNDFYFYPPSGAAASSLSPAGDIQVSAHALTLTRQLNGNVFFYLPTWTMYVSSTHTAPTLLYGTAVITDNVTNSTNNKIMYAPIIVSPLQIYLPTIRK